MHQMAEVSIVPKSVLDAKNGSYETGTTAGSISLQTRGLSVLHILRTKLPCLRYVVPFIIFIFIFPGLFVVYPWSRTAFHHHGRGEE